MFYVSVVFLVSLVYVVSLLAFSLVTFSFVLSTELQATHFKIAF